MKEIIACAAGSIEVSGGPSVIKLLPLGRVHSQKGDFNVDDESVTLIQKAFKGRGIDIVIDYEHQTLADIQAPAGGWIKEIYKGHDAILARVEWTQKAAEYLKNKEYRYLSPVVMVRNKDKKAISIHSAALTNTPAIDGMFALVNSLDIDDLKDNKRNGGTTMELKELAAVLGLPETATEDDIKKAVEAAAKAQKEMAEIKGKEGKTGDGGDDQGSADMVANSTILTMLGLSTDAKTEDVAASIMALKAGGMDVHQEILSLKAQMQERSAGEAVSMALKAGKITAAQKEWAMAYALKDETGFKSFVEKAPVVVPQGKISSTDTPTASEHGNECDPVILKNCNISPEDAKKYGYMEV